MDQPQENTRSFIKQFAYLFMVDINELGRRTYQKYDAKESGYAKATLDSWRFAFQSQLNGKLEIDFIKKIHGFSMSHLPKAKPGFFKSGANNFGFGLPEKQDPSGKTIRASNPNGTVQGFWELADNWLITKEKPVHYIHFKSITGEVYLTPVNAYGKPGLWVQTIYNGHFQIEEYKKEKHTPMLAKCLESIQFRCFINSTPPDILQCLGFRESIEKTVSDNMQTICDRYNTDIAVADTEDKKITVIVRTVQLINQLHPFEDGNVRTSYILLNRLLQEAKMPLCILIDPNRLDGFSLHELKELVKSGQHYFHQFAQGKIPDFRDRYMLELKKVDPVELTGLDMELDCFIQIINQNAGMEKNRSDTKDFGLFSSNAKGLHGNEQSMENTERENGISDDNGPVEGEYGPFLNGYKFP